MKISSNKPTLFPRMYCNLFGHDFKVTKKVTHHVKEYTCRHCKKELTTNSNGKLTELTPKFKEINAILEHIHSLRIERLKKKTLVSSIY
jgi:transposase-like protein